MPLPAPFLARLRQELPADALAIEQALTRKAWLGARINPLLADVAATRVSLLADYGDSCRPLATPSEALLFAASIRPRLIEDARVASGALYLQNPSSWLPVLALAPQLGDEVLDLAAAPGGKTLHLAALLGGSGRLAAVEAVKGRYFHLRENLRKHGASDVHTYLMDGRAVARKTPARFARVLLDAPCSSEARFVAEEPSSYAHWQERKPREAARKQRGLLQAGFTALAPGGRLVYSTCAFAIAENEAVVDALLQQEPSAEVVRWRSPLACQWRDGCTRFGRVALANSLADTCRILPDDCFDGFFVAVLQKRA